MNHSPVMLGKGTVARTPETQRIASLPRRVYVEEQIKALADVLTRELRTPTGTMRLKGIQAVGLYEVLLTKGLLGPWAVGSGKTLFTLLVSTVLEAKRPVLLLPAALIDKTRKEREYLALHWRLPTNLQVRSYEILGRVGDANWFDYVKPDLIIADECHKLKSHRAGVTRRVSRYMKANPETMFVGVSGTIAKSSLKDFGHILKWALKDGAPIPRTEDELSSWADALDEKVNPLARKRPGAIFDLGARPPEAVDALAAARQIFQKRLVETPGVVASGKDDEVACSLLVEPLVYDVAPVTEGHFKSVKDTWTTPDGWTFSEAIELYRHLRSLALGFHGIWEPRPPLEWMAARKAWAQFVRETLSRSRTLDTELQVANHVAGFGGAGFSELQAWREIKNTFTPNPKPVWHDDTALEVCRDWMSKGVGIVWTEHTFFAEELARRTGAVYYGPDGIGFQWSVVGFAPVANIVDIQGDKPVIASIQANSTGRNLQMFDRNLVTSPPPGASGWEQLLGRTHRYGQTSDTVTVDILMGCKEHYDAVTRAVDAARALADTLGHDQKLLLADVVLPDISRKRGACWV